MALQHLRSSTADKRPTPAAMSDGQLALNTNLVSPGLFFKDSNGDSVKIGPVHVGTTAPNVTPGAGGQAGNSKGEAWLDTTATNPILKVWNGSAFVAVQPVGTGTVVSTTDSGTVTSTMILDGTILNADINASAAIVDTKLATIATAGKVSGTAITSGNISTSGSLTSTSTITGANLIPTGSGVPTNGIYLPAANQVAVATNGVGQVFVGSGGSLGVGTLNATNVAGKIHSRADGNEAKSLLVLQNRDAGGSAGGAINFVNGGVDLGDSRFAYIRSLVTGAAQNGNHLAFGTNLDGNAPLERLRITSAGLVGIGTSSPTTNIEVVGVATTDTEVNYALLRGPGSTQPGIYFGGNSTTASTGATARYGYIRSESLGGTARALYLQTGTNTRVVIDNTGQVGIGTTSPTTALQVVGTVTATTFAGALTGTASGNARLVSGTAVSTTSGTSIDFTSIPSWVKRITVTLAQVSTNGASIPLIQLGDSGGVETTGYFSLGASISVGTDNTTRGGSSTDGIRLASNVHTAASELSGNIEIINISGNTWIASGVFIGILDDNADITIARKTLSATLDRIRLTTTGGVNTFDAGTMNILYEG